MDDIKKIIPETKTSVEQSMKNAKEYWHMLGPGLTTGAADDDPSGIATYSQTGSQYGFQLTWLALFSFPLMGVVQEMCARIGIVTGEGLAANIRRYFPRRVLYASTILLLIANIFNLGADLGAMATATQLVLPHWNFGILVVGFGVISLLLQIFTTYVEYAKYLKYLALILLSYVVSAFVLHIHWSDVLMHTIIPHITWSKDQIFIIAGILGTTISPYLFFWQTSQEVEEEIKDGQTTIRSRQLSTTPKQIRDMRIDVWTGMFVSNLVMFFIIAACGAALHGSGITTIKTAADAALALKPFGGMFAYVLFTLGIVGTGMLAVPVLAGSAAYAVSESLGWKYGLYRKLKQAYAFYGVIAVAVIVGIIINFIGLDPIKALIYSAVLNGVIAPIILFFIVRISGSKKIMGEWANKKIPHFIGWLTVGIMTVAAVAVIISLL